jgi:hypothetical protein
MAKVVCCRYCLVEVEPIKLADGTAALVCLDCDVIGIEHEVVHGGPMWAAGLRNSASAWSPKAGDFAPK